MKPQAGTDRNLGSSFLNGLAAWGVAPALIMLLAQWEAARCHGLSPSRSILSLTFGGTLWVYGLDRFLESRLLAKTESRHHPQRWMSFVLGSLGIVAVLFALPSLNQAQWIWFGALGSGGMLYLILTTWPIRDANPELSLLPLFLERNRGSFLWPLDKLVRIVLLKELVGAGLFAWLALGLIKVNPAVWAAFFCMALSNFLWSAQADVSRDQFNARPSLAVFHPRVNQLLARGLAFVSAFLWEKYFGVNNMFMLVALLHFAWPDPRGRKIDLAFLPLLSAPFLG